MDTKFEQKHKSIFSQGSPLLALQHEGNDIICLIIPEIIPEKGHSDVTY